MDVTTTHISYIMSCPFLHTQSHQINLSSTTVTTAIPTTSAQTPTVPDTNGESTYPHTCIHQQITFTQPTALSYTYTVYTSVGTVCTISLTYIVGAWDMNTTMSCT